MLCFCDSDRSRDVLVTGIGMVTPLGNDAEVTWQRLLNNGQAGRQLDSSAIDRIDQLRDIPGLRIHGAPADWKPLAERLQDWKPFKKLPSDMRSAMLSEPLVSMSLAALKEAMGHAQISLSEEDAGGDLSSRMAVLFGSSKGGLRTAERLAQSLRLTENAAEELQTIGGDGFASLWSHSFPADSATRAITAVTRAKAGMICPVAACATGLVSVLQGAAMIRAGYCDVCIVGSGDSGLRATVMSSFHRLRVTSRHASAARGCRPFDESRDGFVIGEGAAVLILESRAHAIKRGAAGLARVTSGAWLSDPTGMTQIDVTGAVVAEVLRRAGAVSGSRIDAIGLHGTGTETNDLAESRGISEVFGDNPPLCYGTKGATGHLLGAAGSVETAMTMLMLRDRIVPGTTNLQTKDGRCDIPLSAKAQCVPTLRRAAKLSLGFGGHVACGVFDAVEF